MHGDLFITPKGDFVGPSQFSKSQETGEPGIKQGIEQKVIMKGGRGQVISNSEKVCDGEGDLHFLGVP